MRVADTSLLIAFFNDRDRFHEEAQKAVNDAEPILVPYEVVVETLGVLQARYNRKTAHEVFDQLSSLPHLQIMRELRLEDTGNRWRHARRNLTWVDAAVVEWAVVRKAKALTFDRAILETIEEA